MSGAIAIIKDTPYKTPVLSFYPFKKHFGASLNILFAEIERRYLSGEIIIGSFNIEQVHAFSGQGVKSVWSFAEAYGRLKQAADLLSYSFTSVTPQKWQKHFNLIVPKSHGLTKVEKKNRNKDLACELSGQKLTHATADAYLIALYGKQIYDAEHQ